MSSTLLPPGAVGNKGAGEKWTAEDRDKALDEYFAGAHPREIGIRFKGSPKAFTNSILNKLRYNYRKKGREGSPGRAERYQPVARVSRRGKRWTRNELEFLRNHRELGLPPEVTARILCRSVEEITGTGVGDEVVRKVNPVCLLCPSLDLIWAYRHAFFTYHKRLISDETYDGLVAEEIEYGGGAGGFQAIKDSKVVPPRIEYLASYLCSRADDMEEGAEACQQ